MKRLTFLFIIGMSFSIYPADDQREIQKQLFEKFITLHSTPCVLLSSTDFLQKYSTEVKEFIEEDLEMVKRIQLIVTKAEEKNKETLFKYFDVLQKSGCNAQEERGTAYGVFICTSYFRMLNHLYASVPKKEQMVVCEVEGIRIGFDHQSLREGILEDISWQEPDVMFVKTQQIKRIRRVLIGLESFKEFQEEHKIPFLTRETFDKYCEDCNAEYEQEKFREESVDGFLSGFMIQYGASKEEYLTKK